MKPPRETSRISATLRNLVHRFTEPFVDVWESNLNDRGSRMMMRVLGTGALVFGVGLFVNDWTKHISKRLEPIPNPVLGYADGVGCERVEGGGYRLSLGDFAHTWCTGADYTCAWEKHVPVIYNKNNPGHCRRADRIGKLSVRDWICAVTRAPSAIAFGIAFLLGEVNDPCRTRRAVTRTALAICLGLVVIATVWSIANRHDFMRFGDLESIVVTSGS